MTKRYGIVQVGNDDAPMFRVFDDGKKAGEWANEKNRSFSFYGQADRVRVIAYDDGEGEDAWKERERSRFADGSYKPLPVGFPSYPDHFAHISNDDPTKIAYVPNAMHGQADRHVRVRPGRYLEAMIGSIDTEIWIKNQARDAGFGPGFSYFIRQMTALYNRAVIKDEVLFAKTPDEIDDVYARGPTSCMSYETSEYNSRINGKRVRPVRVYGAGDLAVAYIVESEDHIVARALCWPERRLYARIYGDEDRLRYALEKLDYNDGSMAGARMLRYPQSDDNQFIAPYLDRPCASCDDDGEFLIICEEEDGEYDCSDTTGLTIYVESYECVECGERIDEDHVYYLDDVPLCEDHFNQYRAERARYTIPFRGELDEEVAVDIEVHNTHSNDDWRYVAISDRAQNYFARRFFRVDGNNYILHPETLDSLLGPNHNLTAVRVEE